MRRSVSFIAFSMLCMFNAIFDVSSAVARTTPPDPKDVLDYMHARYYSPHLGRFTSVDPAVADPSDPRSWNRYSYALGNPIKYVDPTGLKSECSGESDCEDQTESYCQMLVMA